MNYLDWLFHDNNIVQLTHQLSPHANSRWLHGRFNSKESLLCEAKRLSTVGNLFVSLNRPTNFEINSSVDSNVGFKNEDMHRRTRLFFDFDPERNGYICSTDEELGLALARRDYALNMFMSLGWSRPAMAMSGNGGHLLFRTALENTDEINQMIAVIYKGLQQELSTDKVKLDIAVKNIGRIHPLYNSLKRKGDETLERPYRQSAIVIPQQWQQIRPQQIEYLAEHYAGKKKRIQKTNLTPIKRVTGKGDYKTLDAVRWFKSHGLYIQQTTDPIKHWVVCPCKHNHSDTGRTDTCLYTDSDIPTFSCSHNHCAHLNIFDVINLLGDADYFCSQEWATEAIQ